MSVLETRLTKPRSKPMSNWVRSAILHVCRWFFFYILTFIPSSFMFLSFGVFFLSDGMNCISDSENNKQTRKPDFGAMYYTFATTSVRYYLYKWFFCKFWRSFRLAALCFFSEPTEWIASVTRRITRKHGMNARTFYWKNIMATEHVLHFFKIQID